MTAFPVSKRSGRLGSRVRFILLLEAQTCLTASLYGLGCDLETPRTPLPRSTGEHADARTTIRPTPTMGAPLRISLGV